MSICDETDTAKITKIVAIDGPAGAGKSTVAREVAAALGFAFLDTGAMYRAATWWAMHIGADLHDQDALAEATVSIPLEMQFDEGAFRISVDNQDLTTQIRTPEVTENIKYLAQVPEVRRHLVERQRAFGQHQPTVAEGRDIGTIVFPNARCKIYLDATPQERATRRVAQMKSQGVSADFENVVAAIERRDESDMTREVSPLKRAPDAHVIDTTEMTQDEVITSIVELARRSL